MWTSFPFSLDEASSVEHHDRCISYRKRYITAQKSSFREHQNAMCRRVLTAGWQRSVWSSSDPSAPPTLFIFNQRTGDEPSDPLRAARASEHHDIVPRRITPPRRAQPPCSAATTPRAVDVQCCFHATRSRCAVLLAAAGCRFHCFPLF